MIYDITFGIVFIVIFIIVLIISVYNNRKAIKNNKKIIGESKTVILNEEYISKSIMNKLAKIDNGESIDITENPKTHCEYCGSKVDKKSARCQNCGAPTKRKK